jgi:hypothetical protein
MATLREDDVSGLQTAVDNVPIVEFIHAQMDGTHELFDL